MNQTTIDRFIALANGDSHISDYQDERLQTNYKHTWHRDGRAILSELAKLMDLRAQDVDIRSNKAGPGICGEVVLHTDKLYVMLPGDSRRMGLMYRRCNGRKDYAGGANQWAAWRELEDLPTLAKKLAKHAALPLTSMQAGLQRFVGGR